MAQKFIDAYGHETVELNGPALASGAAGTTVAGTIVPVAAGAGTGSSVTGVTANDRRGSFGLTTAGSPAAGVQINVYFYWPYAVAPAAVLVNLYDLSDTTSPVVSSAAAVTAAGFSIISAALTTAKNYVIDYVVLV
jgi:hypothetical protein